MGGLTNRRAGRPLINLGSRASRPQASPTTELPGIAGILPAWLLFTLAGKMPAFPGQTIALPGTNHLTLRARCPRSRGKPPNFLGARASRPPVASALPGSAGVSPAWLLFYFLHLWARCPRSRQPLPDKSRPLTYSATSRWSTTIHLHFLPARPLPD